MGSSPVPADQVARAKRRILVAAALVAAAIATAAALFTVLLVRRAETLPVTGRRTEDMGQTRGGSWANLQTTDWGA